MVSCALLLLSNELCLSSSVLAAKNVRDNCSFLQLAVTCCGARNAHPLCASAAPASARPALQRGVANPLGAWQAAKKGLEFGCVQADASAHRVHTSLVLDLSDDN